MSFIWNMDDILLGTEDLATHKKLLREILRRLKRRGLLLNMEKCKFAYQRIFDVVEYRNGGM